MDWWQTVAIIIALYGFMRSFKKDTDERIQLNDKILAAIQAENREFHKDVKDFYGRLCMLEERNRGK